MMAKKTLETKWDMPEEEKGHGFAKTGKEAETPSRGVPSKEVPSKEALSQSELKKSAAFEKNWAHVCKALRAQLGPTVFNAWFSGLSFSHVEKRYVFLLAPTDFLVKHLAANYESHLRRHWMRVNPSIRGVVISTPPRKPAHAAAPRPPQSALSTPHGLTPSPQDPLRFPPEIPIEVDLMDSLTFESFIVGASNHMAFKATRAMANLEKKHCPSPLFLYGGVGLGKTHLMHATASALRKQSGARVLYLPAERFQFHFVKAYRNNNSLAFKGIFRDIDALLIDDIQFLTGVATRNEFFHIFNYLSARQCKIIVSSSKPPSALDFLNHQMRSRLGGGLVADIRAADYDLRLKILRAKLPATARGMRIPSSVFEFLAQKITSNIRELEGALHRLLAYAEFSDVAISLDAARTQLHDILRAQETTISVDKIQNTVAEYYAISKTELLSRRRARAVARPRQVAMYLTKNLTTRSLPDIGKRFEGRDHTTVLHAVRRVEALMKENAEIRDDVEALRQSLRP